MSPDTGSTSTRERLLDAAEHAFNRRGYAATSIDRILAEVGVTKGAFFHHFSSKAGLAQALIERFAAADAELLRANVERAERLADDPLQQVLVFVGLMIEVAEALDAKPEPGCLFATYCYESGLFGDETNRVVRDAIGAWSDVLGDKLRAAAALHPPVREVDVESLADMLTVVFEGAFVLARVKGGPRVFQEQLRHYRTYLQLLFDA